MGALVADPKKSEPWFSSPFHVALKEGTIRGGSLTVVYKLFYDSLLLLPTNPPLGLAGLTVSLIGGYAVKRYWVEAYQDFGKLRTTAKVTTVSLPVVLGIVIPLGLNSLFHVLTIGEHVNLIAMTTAINFILVPIAKKFQRTLEVAIHGYDERLQRLRMENKALWRVVTFLAIQNGNLQRNQSHPSSEDPQ